MKGCGLRLSSSTFTKCSLVLKVHFLPKVHFQKEDLPKWDKFSNGAVFQKVHISKTNTYSKGTVS